MKKKMDPRLSKFMIHGIKKIFQKTDSKVNEDDNHFRQMEGLVQMDTDGGNEMIPIEKEEEKKKKEKRIGQLKDYKLVLDAVHEYFSSSTQDIMETRIKEKENKRLLNLQNMIKNKKYVAEYLPFEEDETLIKEYYGSAESEKKKLDAQIGKAKEKEESLFMMSSSKIMSRGETITTQGGDQKLRFYSN